MTGATENEFHDKGRGPHDRGDFGGRGPDFRGGGYNLYFETYIWKMEMLAYYLQSLAFFFAKNKCNDTYIMSAHLEMYPLT